MKRSIVTAIKHVQYADISNEEHARIKHYGTFSFTNGATHEASGENRLTGSVSTRNTRPYGRRLHVWRGSVFEGESTFVSGLILYKSLFSIDRVRLAGYFNPAAFASSRDDTENHYFR